jgi:hypothetical protein
VLDCIGSTTSWCYGGEFPRARLRLRMVRGRREEGQQGVWPAMVGVRRPDPLPPYIGVGVARDASSPSYAGGPSGPGRPPPSLISSFKLNGSLSPLLIEMI